MKKQRKRLPENSEQNGREKIMSAAIPLFAEHGIDGVSIRDISKKAGLNVSLVSYYFGGKEQLYREVLKLHAINSQNKAFDLLQVFNKQELTQENFILFFKNFLTLILNQKSTHSDIERIIQREFISGLPYAREAFEGIFDDIGEKINAVFEKAQKVSILDKNINTHALLIHLVHTIEGYLAFNRCNSKWVKNKLIKFRNEDEFINHIMTIYLNGILNQKQSEGKNVRK